MPATFREVCEHKGVSNSTPTGGAGIVVPVKGSNYVFLSGGPKHKPLPNNKAVSVQEVAVKERHNILTCGAKPTEGVAATVEPLKTGELRLFEVSAKSVPGMDKAVVTAKGPKKSDGEAILKVLVLRRKDVKVAIRQVFTRANGRSTPFGDKPVDPQAAVDHMNLIFNPQANVYVTLVNKDPAVFDIDDASRWEPAFEKEGVLKFFQNNKAKGADLTIFVVRTAHSGGKPVRGVCRAGDAIAMVADSREENTIAHETGHFLGAGHWDGKDLLMSDDGLVPGRKIPYANVIQFNQEYTKNK